MINLRYHIVSITAVFLALGIGIAMGSSFLSDAAIDQVDRNIQSTREEARAAREEAGELREELEELEGRAAELREQGAERLFRNELEDVPVLLITVGGVDEDSLELLRTALTGSRAGFAGTLTVTGDVAVPDDRIDTLRLLLDAEDASAAQLRSRLVAGVAEELLAAAEPPTEDEGEDAGTTTTTTVVPDPTPPDPTQPGDTTTVPGPTTTTPPEQGDEPPPLPELVRNLVAEGIMDYEPAPGGLPIEDALEERGHRYVVVSGPDADVADTQFLHPLLRAMTDEGPAPVVVASAAVGDDAEATRASVIAPLLDEEELGSRISTVDDLETISGLAAVVLALDDLGRDRRGHYGIGPGAESQLPLP